MNLAEARNGAAKFGHQRREAIRRRVKELQTLEETNKLESARRGGAEAGTGTGAGQAHVPAVLAVAAAAESAPRSASEADR